MFFSVIDKKPKSLFAQQRKLKQENKEQEKKINEMSVLNDIVERRYNLMDVDDTKYEDVDDDDHTSFPKTLNITSGVEHEKGTSIFSQAVASNSISSSTSKIQEDQKEVVSEIRKGIDEENEKLLQSMSNEEILKEREELMKSLDPGLVQFLRSKRKNEMQEDFPKKNKLNITKTETKKEKFIDNLPSLDILKDENASHWLNMDLIEPEKLEWTKDIDIIKTSMEAGQKYEARFDWKGFLLPYTFESDNLKDDRELYMHGDDQNRPGYTLQELFRLARANVLQQRVSALSAISGILNIYNQGYYDEIVQLPLSKIFFFLRFALDENTPAVIQSTLRGLAHMFYNETDETLLDVTYETQNGYIQPLLNNEEVEEIEEEEDKLENTFKNMNLDDGKMFSCNAEGDLADVEGNDKNNLSDFHLAETNLVDCLLRTNIIERITYILVKAEPNQNIIENCAKILIRIARDSEHNSLMILQKQNLIKSLAVKYLSDDKSQEAGYLIVKLFRIISSYDRSNIQQLNKYGVVDNAIRFICIKEDMSVSSIKLQIECFRFLRLYFLASSDELKHNQLLMPMRYLLEWHYQFMEFKAGNHFIVRTHASALLHLLVFSNISQLFSIFGEIFKMCCCKWYHIATREGVKDFSQKLLLSSLIDVASNFIKFGPEFFYDFIDDYLLKFLKSAHYKKIDDSLLLTSLLFKNSKDRRNVHKPLINLGSVILRGAKTSPTLIMSQDYSAYMIQSLLTFNNSFNNRINVKNMEYYEKLSTNFFGGGGIEKYLKEFCSLNKRLTLSTNWFAKIEIELIFNLLKTKSDENSVHLFKVAFNLLQFFNLKQYPLALDILDKFLFSARFYGDAVGKDDLEHWKFVYSGVVMSKIKDRKNDYVAVFDNWNQSLLENSWTYSLLLYLLYKVDINTGVKRVVEINLKEDDIIKTTLKFNKLLREKEISTRSSDEKLMYLMLIYFGSDLNFLDEDIKRMVAEEMDILRGRSFNFKHKLNNEKTFESLYIMFLETFQANGYGDNLFSSLVMAPLAQNYDLKWRKLVWSEYAMVLRFVKCTPEELLCDLNEYLNPIESDESVILSYISALKSNCLTKDTIPWKIANHHVKHYLASKRNQAKSMQ